MPIRPEAMDDPVKTSNAPSVAQQTEWMTLGQAATFLGVAESTIKRWSDQNQLSTYFTPGGHRRYDRRDLESRLP